MQPSEQPMRVDPTSLATTAAGLRGLGGRALSERTGAEHVVGSLAQRLGPELQGSVQEQWRAAAGGLTAVENDISGLAQALAMLADHFAELDRAAVARPGPELGQR
ncbi:MAG: hypothetical protein QOC80_1482 [Frankiaceae bacterium]|jgi:hypothetical protein|nr:hypothetical protein [Frankiaceae bacterium]